MPGAHQFKDLFGGQALLNRVRQSCLRLPLLSHLGCEHSARISAQPQLQRSRAAKDSTP
jgi:hypothetical protein